MSQLDWLAKWNTLHRPGYKWTKFQQELFDERVRLGNAKGFRVLLYPLQPKESHVVFENHATGQLMACYEKKMIKRAIQFGFTVQIASGVTKPRPVDHYGDHLIVLKG